MCESFKQPLLILVLILAWYVAISAILLLFSYLFSDRSLRTSTQGDVLAIGVPFTVLGIIAGYITGLSRDPAVAAVLPAVLTLVGALILGFSTNGRQKIIAASAVVIYLSLSLVGGIDYGARKRTQYENAKNSFDAQIEKANFESNIKAYRRLKRLDD